MLEWSYIMGNTYKPTNDYMFSRIFGHKKNNDILKDLIEAILPDIHINKIEVQREIPLERQIMSDKLGVLDIIATLNDNTVINIEMQVRKNSNLIDRAIFYQSGLFHENLKSKEDYTKLPKTIGIWILKYHIFDEGPYHEIARLRRDYEDIILTNKFELHFIQLDKFRKKCTRISNKLEEWLTFIINDNLEEIKMIDNEYVKKAENELEILNADTEARELARLREKAIRDEEAAIAGAYAEGRTKGLAEGHAKGLAEGKLEKMSIIAKRMLEKNFDIDTISQITGLSKEEVEKL